MNFFESQERVRKNTVLLVVLFVLAVLSLIVMTNVLVMLVFGFIGTRGAGEGGGSFLQQMDWGTFAAIGVGVCVVVLAGSLYKMAVLSSGGKVVAESLGGQLVPSNTRDLRQRKLLNVVEEMAIASGTPAPPVYLLANEPGINAFAAGFSPRDAVLGVTQGAIDHLDREQLQGVIAHEFSHIFNGDMRLNIRLMGALNGILILGFIGYFIVRSLGYRRRSRDDRATAALVALGFGLMVIGFAGTFFGGLIKASVSRQREYLADASAVQFTRNPNGIAGALKRIGGLEFGSKVGNPAAAEVSHAFFAEGISGLMQWLSATHPPLAKRILRIDPQWDGKYDTTDPPQASREEEPAAASEAEAERRATAGRAAAIATGAAAAGVLASMDRIGNPEREAVLHARTLLARLPEAVRDAAREPYGARAIVYAMLLDEGAGIRERQVAHLRERADPDVYASTLQLMPQVRALQVELRLPIVDIAIPALKQLSAPQYRAFRDNVVALIEMDSRVDLLEWSLRAILLGHLDRQFLEPPPAKARYSDPAQLAKECALVLSVMAHAGARDPLAVEEAFSAAVRALETDPLALVPRERIAMPDLDLALAKLDELKPLVKPRLLKACVAAIVHDRVVTPVEIELLRAFASALDCPMPPVPAQRVASTPLPGGNG